MECARPGTDDSYWNLWWYDHGNITSTVQVADNSIHHLVMASDGISTRWSLAEHPGLAARDPAIIAAVLFRDHARGRDDATVVVVKGRRP